MLMSAVCKLLLRKLRLYESVRCEGGWEWQGHSGVSTRSDVAVKLEAGLWPR
jgi:hypothetical protein